MIYHSFSIQACLRYVHLKCIGEEQGKSRRFKKKQKKNKHFFKILQKRKQGITLNTSVPFQQLKMGLQHRNALQ